MQRIKVSGKHGQGEYERRQRLYRGEELRAALERAGFSAVDVFANPDRTPFEPGVSPAAWLIAQQADGGET